MTNSQVGFFCKSYAPDFKHLAVMLPSFEKHNPDNLPLILSLPLRDVNAFHQQFGRDIPNLRLVADEDYCGCDLNALPGWYAQQICKLTSWRATGLDHYAVIDSDFYFINDVRRSDLTPPEGKQFLMWGSALRSVLELEPARNAALLAYIRGEWAPRETDFPPVREPPPQPDFAPLHAMLPLAADAMPLEARSGIIFRFFQARNWFHYQPGPIYARRLLVNFETFMRSGGLSVEDAIRIAPWENNWYGEYVAAYHSAETEFRVSRVFHVAKMETARLALAEGLDEDRLRGKFLWIAMASRHLELLKLQQDVALP